MTLRIHIPDALPATADTTIGQLVCVIDTVDRALSKYSTETIVVVIVGVALVAAILESYYREKSGKGRQGCCLLNSRYHVNPTNGFESNRYSLGGFRLPEIEIEREREKGWRGQVTYSFSF